MSDAVVRNGKNPSLAYTIAARQGRMVQQHDLPLGYVHGGDTQLSGDLDKSIAGHRAGDELPMQRDRGEARSLTVTRIEDGRRTVDGIHVVTMRGPSTIN